MYIECGVCARVGVSRVRARISRKTKLTDAGSRIGAFEIQVAYRNGLKEIVVDLLHSKLVTCRWPSKSVIEKRIRAFIAKCGIPTHPTDAPEVEKDYGTDGLADYPIGNISWETTALAMETWTFPMPETKKAPVKALFARSVSPSPSEAPNSPGGTTGGELDPLLHGDDPDSKNLNVQ